MEKDIYLHSLLTKISESVFLRDRLLFKGGTCLIKAYLPYYRFSEDIDFGWQDPSIWSGKSNRQIEESCMGEIKAVLRELEPIARSLDLGLNTRIEQKEGVYISNSGTKATFHFSYSIGLPGIAGRIKMEINMHDLLIYPFVKDVALKSFLEPYISKGRTASFLDGQESYLSSIPMTCYSPEEIIVEKGRAILTRVDYKLRDSIDIVMLSRGYGLDLYDFEEAIKRKTRFTVERFGRYRDSLMSKRIPMIEELAESEFGLLIGDRPMNIREDVALVNEHMDQLREEIISELTR